jgi:hypothetical protein
VIRLEITRPDEQFALTHTVAGQRRIRTELPLTRQYLNCILRQTGKPLGVKDVAKCEGTHRITAATRRTFLDRLVMHDDCKS